MSDETKVEVQPTEPAEPVKADADAVCEYGWADSHKGAEKKPADKPAKIKKDDR